MKKILVAICLLSLVFSGNNVFAQLKVGRTKEQINEDKKNITPQLIGSNNALAPTFQLYRLGKTVEILSFTDDINGTRKVAFASVKDETDFYNYVLGLFDDFKNNEFSIGKTRIVPLKMGKILGTKNLAFDFYIDGNTHAYKSLIIGKSGWERLFKKSIINEK